MATMFLENLKASFSDFLRPNLFQVTFSGNLFGEYEFGFLTKGATYPFMTYNTTSIQYNNMPRHFAQSVDYDPISFEFMVDDGLKVLRFFDKWRKLVMNDGSRTFNYKDEYSGNIEIELLNRKQFMRAKCTILDAFPVNIDNLALNAETNDQILSMSVSFRYDDVMYEFDEGFSIAGVKDLVFDLAQGTIGTGIDAIKDGIENAAKKIPDSAIKDVFGGFGQDSGGFAEGENAIGDRSKEIFASGTGGTGVANAAKNAKSMAQGAFDSRSNLPKPKGIMSSARSYMKGAFTKKTNVSSIASKFNFKKWSPF
jgi:hypothetical protein